MQNDGITNDLLSWAIRYQKYGFSVIPVGRDKKPLIEWKKYQTERASLEQVKEWFDKKDPPNIGIVTGEISGITVVDVEKGGDWQVYPVTMTAKSGNGGYHLYYKYAPGVLNSTRKRHLTDIRGVGGYVVAAPSINDSGGLYEWTRKEAMQPFPYALFDAKPQPVKNWQELLKGTVQGSRNDTAAKVIGKFLSSINPTDWQTTAWDMTVIWNQSNQPPLSDKELRAVFNSIVGIRIRSEQMNKVEVEGDCDIKLISEIAKDLTDDMKVSYPTGYPTIDTNFMGGMKEGDLWFITGMTGIGKTTIAQTMSYNLIKTGQPVMWFSFEVPLGEMWRKFKDMGVEDNFAAYAPEKNVSQTIEWAKKKIIEARDRFKTKVVFIDHLGFLSQEPKNYDPNLSSNYATILTMVCRQLKTLAIQENVVIVLLGHLRKPATGYSYEPTLHDIKDSSGVAQEADGVLILHRERADKGSDEVYKDGTIVKIEKNRRTGKTKTFGVTMKEGKLVEEDSFDKLIKKTASKDTFGKF